MTDDARLSAIESIARQALAQGAQTAASLEDLKERVFEVKGDTREARDGVKALGVAMSEQNFPAQMEKITGSLKEITRELRSDMVNAITKVREDTAKHFAEMEADTKKRFETNESAIRNLEDERERRDGGFALFRYLKDYGGWVATIGVVLIAIAGKFHQ